MDYNFLKIENIDGGITILKISAPKSLNALNSKILQELDCFVDSIDPATRVLIITGDGEKSFVAGADISEMAHLDEQEGYEFGKLGAAVYLIYEEPQIKAPDPASPVLDEPMQENSILGKPLLEKPILENPTQVNPMQENPAQERPALDNPIQSNTNRPNTNEEKEKEKTTHSSMINPSSINRSIREPDTSAVTVPAGLPGVRRRLSGAKLTEWVKDQIDYEDLCMDHNRDTIDNIVSLITEVLSTKCDHFTMSGKQVPADLVYERFRQISFMDIEYIFECLEKSCSKIRNIKQYWFTALFNAPASRSNYYDAEVRHDFCFG